ncbi:MAG: acyltransferase [Pseudomonadota bacterium]|jgi:acetyltransferase-like isoleucine patch superfamily enzyme
MGFARATMTMAQLEAAIAQARRHPHKKVHRGELIISPAAYRTPGRETNLVISRFALLDCTGSIHIGPWCNIGPRTRIYTHDTIHLGREPLLEIEEAFGVLWQDKHIGSDVWIHDGAIVLYQVTHIPDGVVVGAGAVLTKNPGAYEIWAGVPARKIGTRTEMDRETIREIVGRRGFSLDTGTEMS